MAEGMAEVVTQLFHKQVQSCFKREENCQADLQLHFKSTYQIYQIV